MDIILCVKQTLVFCNHYKYMNNNLNQTDKPMHVPKLSYQSRTHTHCVPRCDSWRSELHDTDKCPMLLNASDANENTMISTSALNLYTNDWNSNGLLLLLLFVQSIFSLESKAFYKTSSPNSLTNISAKTKIGSIGTNWTLCTHKPSARHNESTLIQPM